MKKMNEFGGRSKSFLLHLILYFTYPWVCFWLSKNRVIDRHTKNSHENHNDMFAKIGGSQISIWAVAL
jgi:hypothetical protein